LPTLKKKADGTARALFPPAEKLFIAQLLVRDRLQLYFSCNCRKL